MLRIVITGPESTGKTTLAKALAGHYNIGIVSEYAREYLEKKLDIEHSENKQIENLYNRIELHEMLVGQLRNEAYALEKMLFRKLKFLMICDTDALTFKIWAEEVFKSIDRQFLKDIEENIQLMNKDKTRTVYLLCSPEGIEWQPDPLRENPNDHNRLFEIYKKNLISYNLSYFILRGGKEKRLAEAIKIINRLMP